MDKIRLSSSDIEFILKWRDEHKDLVRMGISPLKKVKVECYESGYDIIANRDGNTLDLGVLENGRRIGKLVFEKHPTGYLYLLKDTTNLNQEDRQAVLTVYSSTMTLLIFGKATISSEESARELVRKASGKASKKKHKAANSRGYTYILGWSKTPENKDTSSKHKSPSYSFSVRGHYRHYKSGKVIWIAEYTKGTGKKKDKTYKIGGRRNGKEEVD